MLWADGLPGSQLPAGTLAGHFRWHGTSGTSCVHCHQGVIFPFGEARPQGQSAVGTINKMNRTTIMMIVILAGESAVCLPDSPQALSEMGGGVILRRGDGGPQWLKCQGHIAGRGRAGIEAL